MEEVVQAPGFDWRVDGRSVCGLGHPVTYHDNRGRACGYLDQESLAIRESIVRLPSHSAHSQRKGSGTVHDAEISGVFAGTFAFYEPVTNPNVLWEGHYCSAADHRFRFVRQ